MKCEFMRSEFDIEYVESEIEHPILWESHCHARFEMIAVDEGDITVTLEGCAYRLKKNQMILIPPLFYHSVTANEGGSYRRVTARFGKDVIPDVLQAHFSKGGIDAEIDSYRIEKFKEICQKNSPEFYAPLLLSLMVQTFYDALKMPDTTEKTEVDEFLQKAFRYIDGHLHEKILLDDLAQYTLRSKSSFCHQFEEKMKISPKQYILQKKLALANKLISEGVPPTVAAAKVGYDNYSNFYRLYLKRFDSCPTKKKR